MQGDINLIKSLRKNLEKYNEIDLALKELEDLYRILSNYGISGRVVFDLGEPREFFYYTGVVFENYQIPFFEEAKNLALRAARSLPALRLVGWDIVISENGPLLLEGNHLYHIGMSEMAYGGYYRNPVFQKILQEASMNFGEN